MIWAIAILLVLGVMYVSAGQENNVEAELLYISRRANNLTWQQFRSLDNQFRQVSERARLQLQTGKVLLAIGLILMAIKVAMELFA